MLTFDCYFFHRNVILLIFGWRQGSSRHSLLCRISSAGPSANSSKNVFIILASTVDFTSFDRRLQGQNQIQSKENQCHAWYVFLGSATHSYLFTESKLGMNFSMEVLLSVVLYFITVVANNKRFHLLLSYPVSPPFPFLLVIVYC